MENRVDEWAEENTRRLGRAVRDARLARQWTAVQLADRTSQLGYPVSRGSVAKLENGHRGRIDLSEVLVLAAALEVPPALLVYPEIPDGEVRVLPGAITNSWDAMQWLTGESMPTFIDDVDDLSYLGVGMEPMVQMRQHDESEVKLLRAIEALVPLVRRATEAGEPSGYDKDSETAKWATAIEAEFELESARRQREYAERELRWIRELIRRGGRTPPKLDPAVAYVDEGVGQ